METYGAQAYTTKSTDPDHEYDKAPSDAPLRLDLAYPDGSKVALVYAAMPPDSEQRSLMLRLQLGAGKSGFTITRRNYGGEPISVDAIRVDGK
jgi:hypothetical protein